MLSDEVLELFELKGYGCASLFEVTTYGQPGGWQCTIWNRSTRTHVHEQGATPVEAVAAMVARLGGRVDLVPSRSTGKMEANLAARLGDNWAWANLRPTPEEL